MFRTSSQRLAALGGCLVALAAAPAAGEAATGAQVRDSVTRGANWLDSQQTAAGNWSGFGANLVPSAMAAAGRNAADISQASGTTAQDYLQSTLTSSTFTTPTAVSDPASRVGVIEQSVLQGYAAGFTPARIAANQNLAAQLAGYYRGGYFASQPQPGETDARSTTLAAYGALALKQLRAPRFLIDRTVREIKANQHNDGGWNFPLALSPADKAQPGNVDMTGAAMAALCESGATTSDGAVRDGVRFLEAKLIQTGGGAGSEGGFEGEFGGADANSTGWAVTGLNACGIDAQSARFQSNASGRTPVDFLLSLQVSGGADDGAFLYNQGDPFGLGPNVGASQDALRAVAGGSFSVEPPARSAASNPRTRPVPAVAGGTTVPVALAVDNGAGGVTFCRVTVRSGASLATLLANANASSTPAGCATGGAFTAGQLSRLNGQTGTWALSVDGGAEQVAAGQAVRFGDLVALRRTSGAVPGADAGAAATVPAAVQARTTPTGVASKSLRASRRRRLVTVALNCASENRLCQGVVYLVYRQRTLARRPFLIGGGKTTRLKVKLSRRAVMRLGRSRKRVRVNVFSRDGAGIASTSSRTVTLTPTK